MRPSNLIHKIDFSQAANYIQQYNTSMSNWSQVCMMQLHFERESMSGGSVWSFDIITKFFMEIRRVSKKASSVSVSVYGSVRNAYT